MEHYSEFLTACNEDNLEKAQQLLQLYPDIDISANNEEIFKQSCQCEINKFTEIWETFNETQANNVRKEQWHNGTQVITVSYYKKEKKDKTLMMREHVDAQFKTAKWLLENNPNINISNDNYSMWKNICVHSHFNFAKWIFELKPDIINYIDTDFILEMLNNILRTPMWKYSLDFVKWLIKIKPELNQMIPYDQLRHKFIWACFNNKLEFVKFLQSLKPFKFTYTVSYNEFSTSENTSRNFRSIRAKIRTDEEEQNAKKEHYWNLRKYPLWFSCLNSPNKDNLLYKLPTDLSIEIIKYV